VETGIQCPPVGKEAKLVIDQGQEKLFKDGEQNK